MFQDQIFNKKRFGDHVKLLHLFLKFIYKYKIFDSNKHKFIFFTYFWYNVKNFNYPNWHFGINTHTRTITVKVVYIIFISYIHPSIGVTLYLVVQLKKYTFSDELKNQSISNFLNI